MLEFNPSNYEPAIAELLAEAPLHELGQADPNQAVSEKLMALEPRRARSARQKNPARGACPTELESPAGWGAITIVDPDMARACMAGLWLLHNFLDRSHKISQALHSSTGSYWHGIMHRREGDFSNSKYWFHRVGEHPIFRPLGEQARLAAANMLHDSAAQFPASQPSWDPFRFVDLVESVVRGSSASEDICRQITQLEWQLLFDYCYRRAIGAKS